MRTRFAVSPTGLMHVGGLRTALFSFLLAKKNKGTFYVRIEDTDRQREVEGATENILTSLHWAGIDPDEGAVLVDGQPGEKGTKGPYTQSQRLEIYKEYADVLLEKGYAYYAFDTKEELDHMRETEMAHGNPAPKYDASVRMRMKNSLTMSEEEVKQKLEAGEPYVLRFKIPENRTIEFTDEIRGRVQFASHTIDDQVIMKSDGFPTYHLAHVVDDHLMETSLVIRGEEWLPSLPKHILLFEAFEWEVPQFAHVPLLLNKDKSKLSKRNAAVAVQDYIEKGYLPEALLNFLALLGWNPGTTQEVFSLEELIEAFSLDRVQKGGAVFDTEKLDWLQGQWMRKFSIEEFATRIRPLVEEKYEAAKTDNQFAERASLIQDRIQFFADAAEMLSFFYEEPTVDIDLIANPKQKVTKEMIPEITAALVEMLEPIAEWTNDALLAASREMAEQRGWKLGQLLWPLRAILTGKPFSPGATEVAVALGKQETLKRLKNAE